MSVDERVETPRPVMACREGRGGGPRLSLTLFRVSLVRCI